ncbi:MAG: Branched-chain amino acid transporter substrate-binding protein, partial [Pseudomonadota bacterium]|nr:Branched-chain amino acid transporter substrate-binding protein [Pseudomonadota bacterium]
DFKAILTKIKSKKPDLVFYGGMDAQGGPMAQQMKELGLKAKFLGGDGVCTPEFMKLGGAATEGHYCSMPGVPLEKMANGPAFKDKFTKKFNAEIQLYAPNVYDAVMVMVDSMKRANSVDPAKYLEAVGKTSYEGVTAKIEFDDKGDLKGGAISIYQYKGGKLEYVETLGGGVVAAVKEAAAATGEAAKAVAGAAADATKDGAKAVTEAAKDGTKAAAEAVKGAADATKAAVEKK